MKKEILSIILNFEEGDNMQLSEKERLFLYNQYKILERLYPKEPEIWKDPQEILLNGYEGEYDSLTDGMSDGISAEICDEVLSILSMFKSLYYSYQELNDKSGVEESDILFNGFDGNEEVGHYSYAKYLIDCGPFSEFKNSSINSHRNTLRKYRKMLSKFQIYEPGKSLSKQEIQQVINDD
ncbi:MAG: YfbU family protein [Bacillota bacterium]|nr:YfbU family protein [Bacillota bacterium]